jgi:hypothetical protein
MANEKNLSPEQISKTTAEVNKLERQLNKTAGAAKQLSDALSDMAKLPDQLNTQFKQTVGFIQDINNITEQAVSNQAKYGKVQKGHLDMQFSASKIGEKLFKITQKDSIFAGIKVNSLKKQYDQEVARTGKTSEALENAFAAFDLEQQRVSVADRFLGVMKDVGKSIGGALKSMLSFINPLNILKTGFGIIKDFATDFFDRMSAITGQFGALGEDRRIVDGLFAAENTAIQFGFAMEDVVLSTAQLADNFGISFEQADDLTKTILPLSRQLGLSVDEAGALVATFMTSQGVTEEVAKNLAQGAFETAAIAGTNAPRVLKDLAGNTELVARFTADSLDNLVKAAAQARQFGLGIEQTATFAKGLLDIEGTIVANQDLQFLFGKQINLFELARLGNAKDFNGLQTELFKQLKNTTNIQEMSLNKQELLTTATGLTADQISRVQKGLKLNNNEIKSFNDLLGKDGITALTKLTGSFNAIKANITKNLSLPVKDFLDDLNAFLGKKQTINQITEAFNKLGEKLRGFFDGSGDELFKRVEQVALNVESIVSKLASVSGVTPISENRTITKANDGALLEDGTFISSPTGTVQLNDRDSILFGTDLSGGNSSAETLAALTSIAEGLKTLTTETKTSNQAVKTSMESMGSTINSAMGPGGTLYNTAIRVRE